METKNRLSSSFFPQTRIHSQSLFSQSLDALNEIAPSSLSQSPISLNRSLNLAFNPLSQTSLYMQTEAKVVEKAHLRRWQRAQVMLESSLPLFKRWFSCILGLGFLICFEVSIPPPPHFVPFLTDSLSLFMFRVSFGLWWKKHPCELLSGLKIRIILFDATIWKR